MKNIFFAVIFSLLTTTTYSQINQPEEIATHKIFGNYTLHYNVFNSTSIDPKVAETYKLVRGSDRALVNISVTKIENGISSLGLPIELKGIAKNLMQQQQKLSFIEIKEGDATYYLAPFVINNEEILHFDIEAKTQDGKTLTVKFTRTVYKD
jgi:Domain of unknown function (DUF4426)